MSGISRRAATGLGALLAGLLCLAVPPAAKEPASLADEATRPCPADVDPANPSQAWWCGYDPAKVLETVDGKERLAAFKVHPYVNIAAVPTPDSADLDWTCIDGACGGLLDPAFIVGRDLSHLWRPAQPGDPTLTMTEERRQRAVLGRNTWLLWSGGNHAFWDYLARRGFGLADFLKLLDNRVVPRADRFRQLGTVNEPGMQAPAEPDRFGFRLDVPVGWEGPWPPPDPRSLPPEVPDPYVYGYSTGVMGLRLFPNPDFFFGERAQQAQRDWDAGRYFSDVNYAKDPDLVRPYRIGMSCGFCHTSFSPINPPDDPAEPEWRNISATIGGQYLKFGRIAAFDFRETNVLWQLVNAPKPGTVDTSLVATDGINNPNVINAIFNLIPRLINSFHFTETANEAVQKQPLLDLSVFGLGLPPLPTGPGQKVMRILGGGEDSVGGRLALARVYLNIGVFHEMWLRAASLLTGIRDQSPFPLDGLAEQSVYWRVSLYRTQDMAEYLAYASGPLHLSDAPGGAAFRAPGADPRIERGRAHFVTHCMACHSTRQPDRFWADAANWQRWVRDDAYLAEAAALAAQPDFATANFLATDVRYPVTEIGLNIARFLNDNSMEGRVWNDFSSSEYKAQPVLEAEIALAHPYDPDTTVPYRFRDMTGPARVRPLTLTSLWATAPFLHNNAVGAYPAGHDPGDYPRPQAPDVSVAGRMQVFDGAIEALLHLRPRQDYGSIVRTTVDARIEMPRAVLVDFVRQELGDGWVTAMVAALAVLAAIGLGLIVLGLRRLTGGIVSIAFGALGIVAGLFLIVGSAQLAFRDEHRLGRIPAGTPISLIANLNGPGWLAAADGSGRILDIALDLGKVWLYGLPSLDDPAVPDLVPNLLALNKAPDLVLDRGHDFGGKDILGPDGTVVLPALSETARRDLIEYLKTF